jgi:ABC-type Na+ efflux pump permease subunit
MGKKALLLLQKDGRLLVRSRALLAALVLYPLLIAVLVGAVVRYAGERPPVAFVDEDGLPAVLVVGGEPFRVTKLIGDVGREVELIPLSRTEAERRLATGEVAAAIIVPSGFASRLRGMVESPRLVLETAPGGIGGRIGERVQALVYNLNLRLQKAYIRANLRYIDLLRHGGSGNFLGNRFDVVGLERAGALLGEIRARVRDPVALANAAALQQFVREAQLALGQSGDSMRAVANPIELSTRGETGRTWLLSARVQAYALAVTLGFLCVLLAAGAIAAERDENVLGRLARGLVRLGELVAEKIALVALVGLALGLLLALAFGGAVELGHVVGGEPWERVPLLAVGLVLAGAAFGAFGVLLGALSRESRTASLVAFLAALPLVLLGLVPPGAVPAAGWISDAYPFVHAVRLFQSALYDADPWGTLAREVAWLAALAVAFGAGARICVRRLLT